MNASPRVPSPVLAAPVAGPRPLLARCTPVIGAGILAIAHVADASPIIVRDPLNAPAFAFHSAIESEWITGPASAKSPLTFCRNHSGLSEAILFAEQQHGASAIGARFQALGIRRIVLVDLAQPDASGAPTRFSRLVADPVMARWPFAGRSCAFSSVVVQLQAQSSALQHARLNLVEAIGIAECLTAGDVQSITPVMRARRSFFLVTILMPCRQMQMALLDPDTCEFCPEP